MYVHTQKPRTNRAKRNNYKFAVVSISTVGGYTAENIWERFSALEIRGLFRDTFVLYVLTSKMPRFI